MLYIMRHGKTDWNAVHRLQGSEDIPLNDEGRQMAAEAREKYKDLLLFSLAEGTGNSGNFSGGTEYTHSGRRKTAGNELRKLRGHGRSAGESGLSGLRAVS